MSVSDSGAISGARAPAGSAGPIITGPDPSPTRRGPVSPTGPNAPAGGIADAATPRAATAAAPAAPAAPVAPGGKRKSAASSAADEWAKLNDPRGPPAAVKHQSTMHDHMWWKNSRAEEYQHMAGAEATTELRRRAVATTEHHAARAAGGAEYENSLRKKSPASGPQSTPASPPFGGGWTDRMVSAAKRLKQSAADALPHVSPASDIAGDMQSARAQGQSHADSHPPPSGAEAVPVSSPSPTGMEWTPTAATAHATMGAAQRSPKAAPTPQPRALAHHDTAPGKSPLQKLREMVMGKAKPTPSPTAAPVPAPAPASPTAPASPQMAPRSPRSAMSKPAVSHAAPVMDIGSPLPPYRQTEPRAAQRVQAPASAANPEFGPTAGAPVAPATLWGSVKSLFRRAKSSLPAFDIKPASDIKPTAPAAASDRASDK